MGQLDDKVAIVTGSGQGIGRAIAIAMSNAGAAVTVADRNSVTAQSVAEELGGVGVHGLPVTCDVSSRADVIRAVETTVAERGGIDILVNAAHDLRDVEMPFASTTDDHLRRNLESGFFGTFYFLQECYPHLRDRRGSVINFGSRLAVLGSERFFSYAATKEAIRAATRVTAREWGPDGINVNCICPSASDTPAMIGWLAGKSPAFVEAFEAQGVPLGYKGRSSEIAQVAVFLASDAASFITGHTLMVDGGATIDAAR